MSGLAAVLIFVGLFLAGGAWSFHKQQLPKSVVVLMGIGSAMCLVAGILRLEWLY